MIVASVAGNIGKDAEVRKAGNDNVTSFSVASTSKVKGQKTVQWIDCSLFGRRGDALAPYLKKGGAVSVVGELSTREYNGKTYLQVKVDQIELLGGKSSSSGTSSGSGSATVPQDPLDNAGGNDDIPFISNMFNDATEAWWKY